MSGTSLDGLDVAYCTFSLRNGRWNYQIKTARTIPYSKSWAEKLSNAHLLTGEQLIELDVSYGHYLGKTSRDFIKKNKLRVDFISSHGHTVFHQPKKGFTFQIGNGQALHASSGYKVVCDFRTYDVLLGGQGAPLVPVGDRFLFGDYDVCLNLGGIANLSMDKGKDRIAFDLCFCNMGSNFLMQSEGKSYDQGGQRADAGKVNPKLLTQFQRIYKTLRGKRPSLGRELFEQSFKPLLVENEISLEDKLATWTEATAKEIMAAIPTNKKAYVLCTGGGVYNSFLMSRILHHAPDAVSLIIPSDEVVKFKEALVFAFLGVLRVRGEANCLKSVTGASENSSAGLMIGF